MDYRFSFAGLLVGFLIGLTGMGGGSLLAPILILFFRIPPLWAVATDITYSTVTKGLGSIVHIRQKQTNFRVAFWLACGSVPATLLSVLLIRSVQRQYGSFINGFVLHAVGFTLLFVAVLLIVKPYLLRTLKRRTPPIEENQQARPNAKPAGWQKYRPLLTALVGAVVGFLVGLTSVGSGTLIVVSLTFLYPRLTPKELVGTDIFQAFLLLLAGAVGYLNSGAINWPIVGLLLLGSLPGVYLGSKLSKFVPDQYMRPVLAIVLGLSGLKLI
ncbi:MAG: sulfite exporter TauE/SafE family protein [Ktedonobacteraceae bacterium]